VIHIRLLPQAEKDLDLIKEPLLTEVIEKLELLKDYPHWGSAMEGPFRGYRSFIIGIFRVVYRIISSDKIEIAYIRHCRRNLQP
jgi:plasmid stabilization system protein ParE